MIYLDYSATTPVSYDILETYNTVTKEFIGNANSLHSLGVKSKKLYNSAKKQVSDIFNILESEITFTSGATESNNMALIGFAFANAKKGNHIIVSKLEHPSIYKICDYLTTQGFEIDYVNNDRDGLIDFENLKSLMRPTTILVSICSVNSELGVRQPLKMIRQVIHKENENTVLHSDMTQAVGKVSVNLHDVDMASFSGHKIYGPKGIGLFYKSSRVNVAPIIIGSSKEDSLRPGTIALPLVASFAKALRLSTNDIDKKENFVKRLNEKICNDIKDLDGILINKTKISIPHILNISLDSIRPETFIHALEEYDIYVGTNTACSSGDLSTSVMAIYNDKKRAISTIRISISHLTTTDEINKFLNSFKIVYNKLHNLVSGD